MRPSSSNTLRYTLKSKIIRPAGTKSRSDVVAYINLTLSSKQQLRLIGAALDPFGVLVFSG